jgi:hypothetical protein
MYNQIASSYPAPGTTNELRAIVEEQVKDRQGRGLRASLSATAWGPDFPAFHLVLQYTDLAVLQKTRSGIASSTQEFQQRQAPLVRTTNEVDLLEVLVAPNGTTGAGGFRQRNVLTAAVGKAQALRTLLTDWATSEQGRGARMSLLTVVAEPPQEIRDASYAMISSEGHKRRGSRAMCTISASPANGDSPEPVRLPIAL